MSRCICGSTKIICGVISCPIVCLASFMTGTFMTCVACSNCCECFDENFKRDRDKICRDCGVGTSIDVSSYLIRTGHRQITVEHEMIR